MKLLSFGIALMVYAASGAAAAAQSCKYNDWVWSTREKRAVDVREIDKPYAMLSEEEYDTATGCSVCREDQVEIMLPGVEPFQICKVVAEDVRRALRLAMSAGFDVKSVTGYRVGRTKGRLDSQGRRTQYSHHSFGLAIDVNADRNGLYDHCTEFSGDCRLIRGGAWRLGDPGVVTKETSIYREMADMGWRWGGDLEGQQKDFMHFSPSGD